MNGVDRSFDRGIGIPAGGDRFQERRRVFGSMSIDYKVSALDTDGDLFVIENTNDLRGGPPWHLHHGQEEWFYVIEGEYLIEIGDESYAMGPGDSVLAPREVPHVWANVGERRGKLLIAFRPAGKMEAVFVELAKIEGMPRREELERLFSAHGMEITGPPLPVG
jgi:mannose-6-phosphate isomerase-like protein (cupin superfamily)